MFPAKYIVDRAIEDFIDNRKYPLTIKIILTPFYLLNYASGKCFFGDLETKFYFFVELFLVGKLSNNQKRYYYWLFMALKVEYNYDFNSVSNNILLILEILSTVGCGWNNWPRMPFDIEINLREYNRRYNRFWILHSSFIRAWIC